MKLERAHESLVPFFVILITLLVAIGAGSLVGSGAPGKVYMLIGGIGAVAFFLVVRQRMWMLIPAAWMLGGKVSVLPLPATVAQLCVLFAFGTFLLLKAF